MFNPDGGDYAVNQPPRTVTISTATASAKMRYTVNGTIPSQSNGELIDSNHGTASVTPTSEGTTLRAIAFAPGMSDSAVQEGTYTYIGGNGAALMGIESNQSAIAPGYDANGNLIAYKGWSFSYDAQNRLTSASNGAHTALFHYDGKNRQIMRSIDGVVRFSVWDDWELLEEYDTNNARTAAYLQGAHGVIKSLTTNIYYYQDNLGSTTHIANASGALLESYRYDLYGTPSYFNSTSQPLNSSTYNIVDLYAGERWIPQLVLYDLRNRFMSPELGRFLQPDPIGFKGDASNLYRYCGNDPVARSDPTGLWSVWTNEMWMQSGSVLSERGFELLRQGDAFIAPRTGNYKDSNVENHVNESKIPRGDAAITNYSVSDITETDGKLIIRPTLDWYVRDAYKHTDVVKRELEHVSRYLWWQSKEGDGAAAVRKFNRHPTGKDSLKATMEKERQEEKQWHRDNLHKNGRHDLSRNPEKRMNPTEIKRLIENVGPREEPDLGN